jgi:hypothetical protein
MQRAFVVGIVLMFAHKVESWWTEEWSVSPFFGRLVESSARLSENTEAIVGEVIFLVFVTWLFIGLVMSALMMRGREWAVMGLSLWGLTFFMEAHHLIRTLSSWEYYSGTWTGVAYVAFGPVYWRELIATVRSLREMRRESDAEPREPDAGGEGGGRARAT